MTRRERLERKLEKRREWAGGRRAKAEQKFSSARAATEGIPFGQPILVGHHSEKRHRAALDRQESNLRAGVESLDMAEHHEGKADGLESQLDRSIFSDDADAIEQLEARIADLEAERGRIKAFNASCRKGKPDLSLLDEKQQADWQTIARVASFQIGKKGEMPGYVLTNLGGNIRRLQKRVEEIKRRNARSAKAEAAGGVVIEETGTERIEGAMWCRVTFAEKPDREILTALKVAGFYWSSGSWSGKLADVPNCVRELVTT